MKEPIVFRTEPVFWEMLARGEKTWDARRWDLADDRIYRLTQGAGGMVGARKWMSAPALTVHGGVAYTPAEPIVSFQNTATAEVLTFKYLGMEFTPWAPGWCFLLLGERIVEEKGR